MAISSITEHFYLDEKGCARFIEIMEKAESRPAKQIQITDKLEEGGKIVKEVLQQVNWRRIFMRLNSERTYWMTNESWYRINQEKDCFELTDEAPEWARKSFDLWNTEDDHLNQKRSLWKRIFHR